MLRRLPTSAVLLGVPVLACLALRCVDLDRQVFSYNETATSIYTAGYSYADVGSRLHDAGFVSASDILRFQRLTDRTFGSTARSLREEDPQHPPLYFALMRFWLRAFPGGTVPVVTRAFSVVLSLATLPLVFWLARELFAARSTAWTILAVVSVSPFNFVYARHARSYALLSSGSSSRVRSCFGLDERVASRAADSMAFPSAEGCIPTFCSVSSSPPTARTV